MVSFWRRTFGGGGNDNSLPSGEDHVSNVAVREGIGGEWNEQESEENVPAEQDSGIPPPPPPTNAYMHHAAETLPSTPGRSGPPESSMYESATDVPEFHIFQPSVEASATSMAMNAVAESSERDEAPGLENESGDPQIISAAHVPPRSIHHNLSPIQPLYQVETLLLHDDSVAESTSVAPDPNSSAATETSLVVADQPETALSILDSRFDFLKQTIPCQSLQDRALERRIESKQRIHSLECQLASLQARLAQACMDREVAFATVLEQYLYQPLSNLRIPPSPLLQREQALERRLRVLVSRMGQHAHMTLPQLLHDELDSQRDNVLNEWQPSLRLESSKVDKREGSLVRRFESLAGTMSRQQAEEVAVRKSQLLILEEQWENPQEQKRCMEFMDKLQELRVKLEGERELRVEQDSRMREMIAKRTSALKRAFLEAVGDH